MMWWFRKEMPTSHWNWFDANKLNIHDKSREYYYLYMQDRPSASNVGSTATEMEMTYGTDIA